MRKIKEVLRLRFELGLGQRAIARACSISQSTVHEYLKRAEAAKVPRPLPESWDQERVEKALFGERRFIEQYPERVRPDFSFIFAQFWWRRCQAVSPNDEPCDYPATVHCAKWGRWFCDAHAEDEEWHPCMLPELDEGGEE
jgi:hypothetical protein